MEINYNTAKQDIIDTSPFCRFFEYGAHKDGYWNFHHATLQLEDVVDCLVVLFQTSTLSSCSIKVAVMENDRTMDCVHN